jgi:hypothetical protein
VLSKFDDYPIHQIPAPIAHPATGDRNAYDRYWFNGHQDDGEFYFGLGNAIYPNLGITDGGFSIVRHGEQHAFHCSKRLGPEPTDVEIGPFRIEILEPMRSLRFTLDENETGISADLVFTARTGALEEGRQTAYRGGPRLIMDVTRFAQFGRWEGWIRYAGHEVTVDPSRVYGLKDRSWGVRPVGPPDPGIAPQPPSATQAFFLWAPLHWDDRCTHLGVFEDRHGNMWHWDGAVLPAYDDPAEIPGTEDPRTEKLAGVAHEITYIPGTRRASGAVITLRRADGSEERIELEAVLCFRMKGIGYSHPTWGHGMWKGDLAIGGEMWKVDDVDPMAMENQHIQQIVRARSGDKVGYGVLEQISVGPHDRYGFKEFLDPYPG